ncbi:MAG TPA: LysR family transcriptional regulator [Burkholderiaceae bacterium]|nr:LysR family transcriptional regulator [Burkholderiaceae bacterium]
MRLGHFDLNLLVTLDALLETKSVTRASERLCIGASATSSALGRLREHFADELLQQIGRRMELTPLAQSLVQPVRDIILRTQITVGRRPQFDPLTEKRHFVFNASDYIATVFMPKLLELLQRDAPGITVDLLSLADNALERLERGEVDFAIFPERNSSASHSSARLFDENYSCVVWADNPVVGDSLSFDQYMELGHVAARFGATRVASFETWFLEKQEMHRRVEVTASSFNVLPGLVIGTSRIATVHSRLAHWFAQQLPLRVLPPPFEIPTLHMVAQWHKYRDEDPSHVWMRQQLATVAAQLGAAGPAYRE